MTNIVVVFPKMEDAKGIRNLLMKSGYSVTAVCTTGAQAMSHVDGLGSGIIISAYKLADMMYSELHADLPEGVDMLLMASQARLVECDVRNIVCLSMPLKVHDLLETVDMMVTNCERRRRRLRDRPKERKPEELKLLTEAKELLMSRNHMSEDEAHKYLQKCSMDSCTNIVETAQMVLTMMQTV